MSVASTLTSGAAIPTPTACFGNTAPNIRNLTGLSEMVCQINIPPDLVDIQPCCNADAQARVQDDCTQYCEADDNDFLSCVMNELGNSTISQLNAFCRGLNGTATPSSTMPGASSSPTQSSPAIVSTAAAVYGVPRSFGMCYNSQLFEQY